MKLLIFWLIVIAAFVAAAGAFMTQMPGQSLAAASGVPTDDESEIKDRLKNHVDALAIDIGARGHAYPAQGADTVRYLSTQLKRARFDVRETTFDSKGKPTVNVEGTLIGTRKKDEVLLLGANWDSQGKSPGADDNASGCAVLLEIARLIGDTASERTVRIVFFGNGGGSYAGGEESGAWAYAREAQKRGDKIVTMLDFDCLGNYNDKPGSQSGPFPISTRYPSVGNFVLFAGDLGARDLVRRAVGEFRKGARMPCHGVALPGFLPGMHDGDFAAFAHFGFPALVVTDTGQYRFDKIGTLWDTVDRLEFERMARATAGIARVINALAKTGGSL